MTPAGRFAIRLFDYLCGNENKDVIAADLGRSKSALDGLAFGGGLLDFIVDAMEKLDYEIPDDSASRLFFDTVAGLSDIMDGYRMSVSDAALMLSETLRGESVRPPISADYDVGILGTAESRMQTADVVVITGLSDGMFPADGFRHNWLPRDIAHKTGIPSSDSKVSLMALDFMTLSCGTEVYWTRSKMAGGGEAVQSRFLSRVGVMAEIESDAEILDWVRAWNTRGIITRHGLNPLSTTHTFFTRGTSWGFAAARTWAKNRARRNSARLSTELLSNAQGTA